MLKLESERDVCKKKIKCCLIPIICLFLFSNLCGSAFVSDVTFGSQVVSERRLLQAMKHVTFGSQVVSERRLLQAMKHCPVNFEFQNYTILTSKCKGPDYLPKPCCSAFKEFACQFVEEIDDLTNDCASVMFNYINLKGKYPAGLFASLCREGKEGLACPEPPRSPPPSSLSEKGLRGRKNNGNQMICEVLITVASLVLSLQFI
ncbi:hypothetical protein BUALT_Bualt18G0079600 [Buddleja alternifolia]|uniref:GPI-anchored protein LLG1-like domain-containing protein n=1 Tax=Buddleja alternifolia TaxID=168488 RepID=A0AAV6WE12_9LAMI|nr:hypothetical protein BUALT_Bualt18G0079600 [Buddleja alternifolia]